MRLESVNFHIIESQILDQLEVVLNNIELIKNALDEYEEGEADAEEQE